MKSLSDKNRKQLWARRACLVVLCVMATVGLWSLLLPKPTESKYEQRELAKRPALSAKAWFGKTYATDFDAWYSDTFPLRDTFATFAGYWENWKGVRSDGVKIYGPGQSQSESSAPSSSDTSSSEAPSSQSGSSTSGGSSSEAPSSQSGSSSSQSESSSAPQVDVDDNVNPNDGYLDGSYIVTGDRGFFPFGGNLTIGYEYADAVSRLAQKLSGTAQVYDIIVPTAVEFYMPSKYSYMTNSEKENIQSIYARMGSGVRTVDAYGKLASHTSEYIYLRTDHHWTALGAYYAFDAYCAARGVQAPAISAWEKRSITGYLGTVYSGTNKDPVLGANPDTVDYYITGDPAKMSVSFTTIKGVSYADMTPWYEQADGYGVFIWGDNKLYHCVTGLSTGRNVVLIKDSFGNAFAPFLFSAYDNVWVIDYRYWDGALSDFVKENGIDDVIFLNNVFTPNTKYHAERINTIAQ